jgi:hypothetical protein
MRAAKHLGCRRPTGSHPKTASPPVSLNPRSEADETLLSLVLLIACVYFVPFAARGVPRLYNHR